MELSTGSLEYVKVPVAAVVAGAVINPTTDTVQMAFPVHGAQPVAGDWKTASWETEAGEHLARCLVGATPGVIQLVAGIYDVWVRVTDSPEIPAKRAPGTLTVY